MIKKRYSSRVPVFVTGGVLLTGMVWFARMDWNIRGEDVAELRAVNTDAPLALARMVAAQAGGGCVVHLLDCRIARADGGSFAQYAATKRELADSVARLAREWAPRTRVNGVALASLMETRSFSGVTERICSGSLLLASN